MREHGTHVCYVFGPEPGGDPRNGCRCDPCRAAATAYERERSQRIAPAYVGAAEARAHMRWLAERGVGMKTVAKVSGVSHGSLWKLMYGKNGKPSKRIRPATRDRILAVTPADAADGAKVAAGPVWTDIHTLLERGWTRRAIAQAISGNPNANGLQLGQEYVTAANARAVAELLDQPVPPRRSRHGIHPVEQPDNQDDEPERPAEIIPGVPAFLFEPEPWRERSACRLPNVPSWIFFPGRGDHETVQAAKAVCRTCPVATECAEAHLHERFGIWGGLSETERRRIRRDRGLDEDEVA